MAFQKRPRVCENSDFSLFWCRWLLDVDLSCLQVDEKCHKSGPFRRFEEHPIVSTQSGPFLERLLTADIYPSAAKTHRSSTLTFEQTKCCALYEWLQWRAALQHFEVVANGGKGPNTSVRPVCSADVLAKRPTPHRRRLGSSRGRGPVLALRQRTPSRKRTPSECRNS
jgi:hypothetical protein